jgi:aminopeptidase
MLNDTHLKRYADVLLWGLKTARSNPFKKGDIVLIRFNLDAIGLAEILEGRLLEMGMNPVRRLNPTPTMEKTFFELANRRQLVFDPPGEAELYGKLNGSIFLHAPASITHFGVTYCCSIRSVPVSLQLMRKAIFRPLAVHLPMTLSIISQLN